MVESSCTNGITGHCVRLAIRNSILARVPSNLSHGVIPSLEDENPFADHRLATREVYAVRTFLSIQDAAFLVVLGVVQEEGFI
jgi:hypothetical protein